MDELIFRKAHELAELVSKSTEMNEVDRVKMAIMNDPNTAKLWGDWHSTIQSLKEVSDKDEHSKLLQKYQALADEIQANQLFSQYFECERNLNELISSVNFIINRSLFGEDKAAKNEHGCGGGCAGCSGCNKKE